MPGRRFPIPILLALLALASIAEAQVVALDKDETMDDRRTGWLPYAFSSESLDTTFGVAGFSAGRWQPQTSLFGTVYGSLNDSYGGIGAFNDLLLFGSERVFLDTYLLFGHFTDSRFYIDLDNNPAEPRAGSNDSGPGDFVTGVSNNFEFEAKVKVPLPIGNAAEDPIGVYTLDRGQLLSGPVGGDVWNPWISGRTTVAASLFVANRDLDEDSQEDVLVANANGVRFELEHDNTDFPRNPARGSRQRFALARDFGLFESSGTWTNWEASLSKYFDLGTSGWFRQQVLAVNAWTSSSPTWDVDGSGEISNRPPPFLGATLGGFDRLRGYPIGRFSDKSALYYAAELRMMPQGNPLRDAPLLDYFEIDWMQLVAFFEGGRVGPHYDSELLFEDHRYSFGLDLRLMAFRSVVRLGVAWSEEGAQVWAMFGQPFAR